MTDLALAAGWAVEVRRAGRWQEIGRSLGAQQPASAIRYAAENAPGGDVRILSPDGREWRATRGAHKRRWMEVSRG